MRERLTRILPYRPHQLFELVGDVERYPQFVPWVARLSTRKRCEEAPGVSVLEAEADVGFAIIHETFSTRVRLDEPALTIEVDLITGPFRKLHNRWRFSPHGEGTELKFDIDFEFRSRLLSALFAANAHRAVGRLVGCFEARAKALYGGAPG